MLDLSQFDFKAKKLLIDADSLIYKISYVVEDKDTGYKEGHSLDTAKMLLHNLINHIMEDTGTSYNEMFLTKGKNFRYGIAKTHPYKGNRVSPKPLSYDGLFKELTNMGATVVQGLEADDAVRIRALELGLDNVITAFIDKDLLMIGGLSFDYGKMQMREWISEVEALRYFYKQLLTGDTIDNIKCIKGIGKVGASKMIDPLDNEEDMANVVLQAYIKFYKDDVDLAIDRLSENTELLWLKRSMEDSKWEELKAILKL